MEFIKKYHKVFQFLFFGVALVTALISAILLLTEFDLLALFRSNLPDIMPYPGSQYYHDVQLGYIIYNSAMVSVISFICGFVIIAILSTVGLALTYKNCHPNGIIALMMSIVMVLAIAYFACGVSNFAIFPVKEYIPLRNVIIMVVGIVAFFAALLPLVFNYNNFPIAKKIMAIVAVVILVVAVALDLDSLSQFGIILDQYRVESIEFGKTLTILSFQIITAVFMIVAILFTYGAKKETKKETTLDKMNPIDAIERLKKLYDSGALTQQEYEEKRKKYVAKL